MPELPEVETLRRDLERVLIGRTINDVHVSGVRTVRRHDSALLQTKLSGACVKQLRRKGKYLIIDFDGKRSLVVHLRMSGRLRWFEDASAPEALHTHARLQMVGGDELRFVDPRTFGEMWVTTDDVPELSHLGPDAYDALPQADELGSVLRSRKSLLKALLLNQEILAGLGNIYTDETLFLARLRPDRTGTSLTRAETETLREAIAEVLAWGVELRGSSLADRQYVDLAGQLGKAQSRHAVYARESKPCLRCGNALIRVKIAGRSTFFCHDCQR